MAKSTHNIGKPLYPEKPRFTLKFPFGLNESDTPQIGECIEGYNFDLKLDSDVLRPRAPFDLKGTATNSSEITGLLQLVKRDATQTTLVVAGSTVYLWDGGSTFTSKGTVTATALLRDTYWSLDDYLVITDLNWKNVVKKWDGTTFENLTTGLSDDLYAKYAIQYLGRMWLFNVKTSTETPHLMVASAFEDPTSYDTSARGGPATSGGSAFSTGLEAFYMLTPDLRPINGVALYQDTLIISTDHGKLFKLTGSSASDFAWVDFFDGSPAVGTETVANIGNDVVFMREGGHINLLSATQLFGDVKAYELSRWIPDSIKNLTDAITVYDKIGQRVLFFVNNEVLVLFKNLLRSDRTQLESGNSAWSKYITDDSSNFNTKAARFMYRPGTTDYSVFFGDSTGRVFDLNGEGSGDAGSSDIKLLRKSRVINNEVIDPWPYIYEILHGRVQYRRNGPFDLTLSFDWDDEYNVSSSIATLKGAPAGNFAVYFASDIYFGGDVYFSEGFVFEGKISSKGFSPTGKGPGFFLSVSADTKVQYQVDKIEFY